MFYVKQTATDADWSRETDTGPKCNAAWQNCTFPVEARTHTGFIWVLCSGAVLWFVVGTSRWVEMGRDVWVCAQVRVHVYWMNDFSIARLLPEEACNRLCPLLQGRSKLSAARHWARAPSGSMCVCVIIITVSAAPYISFLRVRCSHRPGWRSVENGGHMREGWTEKELLNHTDFSELCPLLHHLPDGLLNGGASESEIHTAGTCCVWGKVRTYHFPVSN